MKMAGQQICLKWNSFQANIVTSFENLWEEEGLVDVTLASDGQCLRAHKVILSACSPFFRHVFQTNPCQHPVIILQDVHFSELESLLSFVYKGEVNIEQENLPALLRAAETLQIRGLSGASEQVKEKMCASSAHLAPSSPASVGSGCEAPPPPKRLRPAATAAAAAAPTPVPAPASLPPASPSPPPPPGAASARSAPTTPLPRRSSTPAAPLDLWGDPAAHGDSLADGRGPKAEPSEPSEPPSPAGDALEDSADDASVGPPSELMQAAIKMDPGQIKGEGEGDGALGLALPYQNLPYACLLPRAQVLATWAKARTLEQLACDLMKILFTTEERILCNVNGKMGKRQFNVHKIQLIREVLHFFSNMPAAEFEEQWKSCVTKIDTANRGLKRNLVLRGRRATCLL